MNGKKKSPWVREGKISVGILGGEGQNLCGKFTHFWPRKNSFFVESTQGRLEPTKTEMIFVTSIASSASVKFYQLV